MNKTIKYTILLLLTFTLVTMPLTVPLFKSSADYSIFNPGKNGLSRFARLSHEMGKKVVPVIQPFDEAGLGDKNGVLFIVGPNVTFARVEIGDIKDFLKRGNTVVIADDFGTGNEILRELNVPIGISRYPLHDFFYEKDDRLIVVVRILNPILARNVSKIVTNEPSGIIITRGGDVYASRVSMINLHRRIFPIMAEVKYGRGKIVVISDPDVLTNMQFDDNRAFLRNLIDYLGGDTFYFDETHHPDFNLYTAGTVTITRVLPGGTAIKLILTVGILILGREIGILRPIRKKLRGFISRLFGGESDLEEIAVSIARENGWDVSEVIEMLRRMGG